MDSSFTAYLTRLPPRHPVRKAILESWQRCEAAGVARDGPVLARRVGDAELQRRLRLARSYIEAAKPRLAALVRALPGSTNVAYITDADGIVLHCLGDPQHIACFSLSPGHDWSEQAMGTNGAGTCLRTGRPIAVIGSEHFKSAFDDCTCTAAPVRGRDGTLLGALDVSSNVREGSFRRLADVVKAARGIEDDLAR